MKNIFGASWKTTVGGILSVLSLIASVYNPALGAALNALGTAIVGLSARDNTVTSEQAGAAPAAVVSDLLAKAQVVAKEQAAQSTAQDLPLK